MRFLRIALVSVIFYDDKFVYMKELLFRKEKEKEEKDLLRLIYRLLSAFFYFAKKEKLGTTFCSAFYSSKFIETGSLGLYSGRLFEDRLSNKTDFYMYYFYILLFLYVIFICYFFIFFVAKLYYLTEYAKFSVFFCHS